MGISMIPNAFFLSTLSDRTLGLAKNLHGGVKSRLKLSKSLVMDLL